MTYIEFFEKNDIDNLCAALNTPPERVILVGTERSAMQAAAARYEKLFSARGKKVEFICKIVPKDNRETIIEAFNEIVNTYDECAFDITGGAESYIMALGIFAERAKSKNIQIHRFNITANLGIDWDGDGKTPFENQRAELSVAEYVSAYGGLFVNEEGDPCSKEIGDVISEAQMAEIDAIWEISRNYGGYWNFVTGILAKIEALKEAESDDGSLITRALVKNEGDNISLYIKDKINRNPVIRALQGKNLLAVTLLKKEIRIVYKNSFSKRILLNAGKILEMKIFAMAVRSISMDRKWTHRKTYNDVKANVVIDWDGIIEDSGHCDIRNEIDVILMHGMTPILISCKNGKFDREELFMLNSVANRFGGRYVKKVLFTNRIDKNKYDVLCERANELGITLIDCSKEKSLQDRIDNLWKL